MNTIADLKEHLTAQVIDLPEAQRIEALRDLVVHFVELSAYETGKLVGSAPATRIFHAAMQIERSMPTACASAKARPYGTKVVDLNRR